MPAPVQVVLNEEQYQTIDTKVLFNLQPIVCSPLINGEFKSGSSKIRYKTSIDVADDHLSFALIQQLVYTNVTVMDRYSPGIQTVLLGEATRVEAIWVIATLRLAGVWCDHLANLRFPPLHHSSKAHIR